QFLVYGGDSGGLGIARAVEWLALLLVHLQRALVRTVHAGDDLDQGRFAGAVLANQRVNLARQHVKAYTGERLDAWEAPADVRQFKDWLHRLLTYSAPSSAVTSRSNRA